VILRLAVLTTPTSMASRCEQEAQLSPRDPCDTLWPILVQMTLTD